MEKTRDLFKKIRDTEGTFHAKMGSKKDRNGMDLTETEDIKKRQQEYTEELHKKDLSVQFSHSVVSDSLQPLNCSMPGLPVHAKLGSVKDRQGMDLTEAEDIKKRQ